MQLDCISVAVRTDPLQAEISLLQQKTGWKIDQFRSGLSGWQAGDLTTNRTVEVSMFLMSSRLCIETPGAILPRHLVGQLMCYQPLQNTIERHLFYSNTSIGNDLLQFIVCQCNL